MRAVNLFAGAGGWEEGATGLGIDIVGIEHDETIAETNCAAGHACRVGDVAAALPEGFGRVDGLIASPPCQAYSTAGKGKGRADKSIVAACAHELALGHDTRAHRLAQCQDPRSLLTVEPIRWAEELRPTWIALEQVPPVLELWTHFAGLLEKLGYRTAVGVLQAEQYGVPQTRKRAILIASLDGPVKLPEPTHSRYYPRSPEKLDPGVKPWVSMAEALGWGGAELRSNYSDGSTGDRGYRDTEARCFCVTSKAGRMKWLVQSARKNATVRPESEQAPTLTGGHSWGERRWVQRERSGDRAHEGFDPHLSPCQTLTSKARSWTVHRPATTVNGDPRISRPGRDDPAESGSQQRDAIRVSVQEASILQSFRPDYPWQGSRTKQFLQVGNAVPPLLARAVLKAAIA